MQAPRLPRPAAWRDEAGGLYYQLKSPYNHGYTETANSEVEAATAAPGVTYHASTPTEIEGLLA